MGTDATNQQAETLLDGTVQIVCGAGGGLGEETAVAMARHGATVVVNDLGVAVDGTGQDTEPAAATVERIESTGGEATTHCGDVTDLDYTETLISETVARFGAVHGITNFAGILRDSMIFNMSEADWDAVIDVHLKGHFSLLHNASAHWREQYKQEGFDRQRSFCCVSSGASAGNPGQSNYSAAKAGILGLMRTTARELNQYDVRVNALWPTALTRMTEGLPALAGVDESTFGPRHIAPMPVFLASEHADDVTGCTLAVAGDSIAFVSDPERERSLTAPGEQWQAKEIVEQWDTLTEGFETTRLTPGY